MIYLTTLVFILALYFTKVMLIDLIVSIIEKNDFNLTNMGIFVCVLWGIFFHLYNFVV